MNSHRSETPLVEEPVFRQWLGSFIAANVDARTNPDFIRGLEAVREALDSGEWRIIATPPTEQRVGQALPGVPDELVEDGLEIVRRAVVRAERAEEDLRYALERARKAEKKNRTNRKRVRDEERAAIVAYVRRERDKLQRMLDTGHLVGAYSIGSRDALDTLAIELETGAHRTTKAVSR